MDPIPFLKGKIAGRKIDGYEIYRVHLRRFSVEAREGRVESVNEAVEQGVALRLFRQGRVSFASSSAWDPSFLERIVELSYNTLTLADETGSFLLPAGRPPDASRRSAFLDPALAGISGEEKAGLALRLEESARRFDRRIVRVRGCRYEEERVEVTLHNSSGLNDSYERSAVSLSLMAVADEKGDQQSAWDEESAVRFSDLDPDRVGRRCGERAVSLLGARPIPTGRLPALLEPVVGASLLGVLASSFLADQVQKNRSALKGKIGETVCAAPLSLVDDPSLAHRPFSAPFDDEGVATGRKVLVQSGRLVDFLYDLRSASRESRPSTGHAQRPSYKEPPRVAPTNLFWEKGRGTEEDLKRELGTGFWIRDLIGLHTADPVTGDFSLGATGFWVEKGEPLFPVRGVAVSGNLHELFRRVVRAGEDLHFYHAYGSPSLLVSQIDVGGS